MGKEYSHFTEPERIQLATLDDAGFSALAISEKLNKHKSSIYRELGSNISSSGYSGQNAHVIAAKRRAKKSILETDLALQSDVICLLKKHYSPRQISVTLKDRGRKSVSHETIYKFVYSKVGKQLELPQWLPRRA